MELLEGKEDSKSKFIKVLQTIDEYIKTI